MPQRGHFPGSSEVWSGCIGHRYPTSRSSSVRFGRDGEGTSACEATRAQPDSATMTVSVSASKTGFMEFPPLAILLTWVIKYTPL